MKIFVFLGLSLFLLSCASVHSNKVSYAQVERERLRPKAESGDADAQYQLGNSWCCGENGTFFSTTEAAVWWCKAAKQGHEKANQILLENNQKDICFSS